MDLIKSRICFTFVQELCRNLVLLDLKWSLTKAKLCETGFHIFSLHLFISNGYGSQYIYDKGDEFALQNVNLSV